MKKVIYILLFIQFFNLFAGNLLGPVYAIYVKGIGGDLLTAGSALALNLAIIGSLIILSGRIANKYHTEKLQLILGYSIGVLVAVGYLIIQTPMQLFFVQILSGLSIAIAQPASSGIFSARLEKGQHTSSWGDYLGLTYWAAALSALSSGFISQNFGFPALFYSMIITQGLSVLGAIYLYYLPSKDSH